MGHRNFVRAAVRAAVPLMAAIGGCQTGGPVGGREFPVTLKTDPPDRHAVAYVIPYNDWVKAGEDRALNDTAFLKKYEVKAGLTEVTVKKQEFSYVYVAELNGKRYVSDRFTPGADKSVTVRVD